MRFTYIAYLGLALLSLARAIEYEPVQGDGTSAANSVQPPGDGVATPGKNSGSPESGPTDNGQTPNPPEPPTNGATTGPTQNGGGGTGNSPPVGSPSGTAAPPADDATTGATQNGGGGTGNSPPVGSPSGTAAQDNAGAGAGGSPAAPPTSASDGEAPKVISPGSPITWSTANCGGPDADIKLSLCKPGTTEYSESACPHSESVKNTGTSDLPKTVTSGGSGGEFQLLVTSSTGKACNGAGAGDAKTINNNIIIIHIHDGDKDGDCDCEDGSGAGGTVSGDTSGTAAAGSSDSNSTSASGGSPDSNPTTDPNGSMGGPTSPTDGNAGSADGESMTPGNDDAAGSAAEGPMTPGSEAGQSGVASSGSDAGQSGVASSGSDAGQSGVAPPGASSDSYGDSPTSQDDPSAVQDGGEVPPTPPATPIGGGAGDNSTSTAYDFVPQQFTSFAGESGSVSPTNAPTYDGSSGAAGSESNSPLTFQGAASRPDFGNWLSSLVAVWVSVGFLLH